MKRIVYLLALLMFPMSCTDLEEGVFDQQIADDFYATEEGINAALAAVYNEVRGDWGGKGIAGADRGWYDLNETCTDEMMLPTRSDGAWDDNGIWRQMYTHTWTASQEFMGNTWDWLYRSIFKANLAVELLEGANADAARIAEAKVLRAYFYYMLMDGWGSVPFYTENNVTVDQIPQASRTEIFDAVVKDLNDNVELLPETVGGEFYGRFNKWATYALLQKIYINAEVYTGTAKNAEAISAGEAIINSGLFSLKSDLYDDAGNSAVFGDVLPNEEVLLSVFVDGNNAPRNMIGIRTLHGPHGNALFGFSTWNGATAHQNFVNKYDNADKRKAQWFTGAQPGGVNYSLNISSLTSAGIQEGARNAKFLPVPPYDGGTASNDFPVLRYADVLLTQAEALLRSGGSEATARGYVDDVRTRAGLANFAGTMTLDEIYDERGRELCWEGHRRQDMIRFGKFLEGHDFKAPSASLYTLFPIPANALSENPTLTQNTGY